MILPEVCVLTIEISWVVVP